LIQSDMQRASLAAFILRSFLDFLQNISTWKCNSPALLSYWLGTVLANSMPAQLLSVAAVPYSYTLHYENRAHFLVSKQPKGQQHY
jgi:hypothetical protein